MAAAIVKRLWNDIQLRKLVTGFTNRNPISTSSELNLFQEDKICFVISFLDVQPPGVFTTSSPYLYIDHGALSLTVKLFKLDGTVLASQTVWTADNLSTEKTLTGTLDLNTANMVAAMTGQTSLNTILEFQLGDGTGTITSVQETVKVNKEYITSGSPSALPLASYLTREECMAMFVRFYGNANGSTIDLPSADGTKHRILGANNDGSFDGNVA